MEKCVSFFSGGKDGLYALYLAQKQGMNVRFLLTLKTTIGLSPHYENIDALQKIARTLKKHMVIFDMKNGNEELSKFINSLEVSGIVGGDIYLEEHLKWIDQIAKGLGIKVVEPLWGRNSTELVNEMISEGFEYSIIAVDKKKLSKEWLGYTFGSLEDVKYFADKNAGVDPAGEGGEFHTVVINSPLFEKRLILDTIQAFESDRYHYLKFSLKDQIKN